MKLPKNEARRRRPGHFIIGLLSGSLALSVISNAAETGNSGPTAAGSEPSQTGSSAVGEFVADSLDPLPDLNSTNSNQVLQTIADPNRWAARPTAGLTAAEREAGNYWWQRLNESAYQVPVGGHIDALKTSTATPFSYQGDHTFLGLGLGSTTLKPKAGNMADSAMMDNYLLGSGVVYRHFFAAPYTFLSPYFSAGANVQTLVSSYRNNIAVGPDTASSYDRWGMDGYAGVGMAFATSKRFSIFSEADFGGTTLQPQPVRPVNNEALGNVGYLGLKAGLSLRF